MPVETAPQFLDFVHTEFNIYPLWLCPISSDSAAPFHEYDPSLNIGMTCPPVRTSETQGTASPQSTAFWLDIGVWGWAGPPVFASYVAKNRNIEVEMQELQGRKWLHARAIYSEEEFWEVYVRGVTKS